MQLVLLGGRHHAVPSEATPTSLTGGILPGPVHPLTRSIATITEDTL